MNRTELEQALRTILDTLAEYLGDLILVGGWVPYLHLTYGEALTPGARTSLTADADIVVPTTLEFDERRPISEALQESGFRPLGDSRVVWVREPERGETIEFLQPHEGTARSRGTARSIQGQPGIRVLLLEHLWVLERFTCTVEVPASDMGSAPAPVRVPTLGAFILNKANTFSLRGGPDSDLKAGKDLVYLRDILAAGDDAITIVERDLAAMLAEDDVQVESLFHRGDYHIQHVSGRFIEPGAELLAERDGMSLAHARADLEGHLMDLRDVLVQSGNVTDAQDPGQERPDGNS